MRTKETVHRCVYAYTSMCVCVYVQAFECLSSGTKRPETRISGCSFCKYLKSRRVVDRGCATPHGCTMEFSILCREIALINETTWPSETLFVTACGRRVYRRAVCYIILYATDWFHLARPDRHIAVNWMALFKPKCPSKMVGFLIPIQTVKTLKKKKRRKEKDILERLSRLLRFNYRLEN